MPVTIVSDPDWLLTGRTDACRDDLCEKLFILGVGQELIQIPVWVEINDFRLAFVDEVGLAGLPVCTAVLARRLYHGNCICTILLNAGVLLLLHLFLQGHGLGPRVKRNRLDPLAAFFGRGNFRRAVVLSYSGLGFCKFDYCLELLRIF